MTFYSTHLLNDPSQNILCPNDAKFCTLVYLRLKNNLMSVNMYYFVKITHFPCFLCQMLQYPWHCLDWCPCFLSSPQFSPFNLSAHLGCALIGRHVWHTDIRQPPLYPLWSDGLDVSLSADGRTYPEFSLPSPPPPPAWYLSPPLDICLSHFCSPP